MPNKDSTRDERHERVGRLLALVGETIRKPVIDHHRRDLDTCRELATRSHAPGSELPFRDAGFLLAVLLNSPAIRARALDDGPEVWAHLDTLRKARNAWAHFAPISENKLAQYFAAASAIIDATSNGHMQVLLDELEQLPYLRTQETIIVAQQQKITRLGEFNEHLIATVHDLTSKSEFDAEHPDLADADLLTIEGGHTPFHDLAIYDPEDLTRDGEYDEWDLLDALPDPSPEALPP